MGYRSYFTITVKYPEEYVDMIKSTGVDISEVIQKHIERISGYSFDKPYRPPQKERTLSYLSSDEMKWYDWVKDIAKISSEFPELEFDVHMDGEDSEDHRKLIAKNGKTALSHGKITYWTNKQDRKLRDEVLAQKVKPSAKHFIVAN